MGDFVSALRKAELEVSPAETLVAMEALDVIGWEDKRLVRDTLSIILAKTATEKRQFDQCFDRFFSFNQFAHSGFSTKIAALKSELTARIDNSTGVEQADSADTEPENEVQESTEQDSDKSSKKRRRQASGNKFAHHDAMLGHLLLSGDQGKLAVALHEAAESVHLERIKTLRERSLYARRILIHMGVGRLDEEIHRLAESEKEVAQMTAKLLTEARRFLEDEVRRFVEEQYFLLVDGTGHQFIANAATQTKLTNMQPHYFDHIREAVRKLAHQLAKRHAKKRRVYNRGQLDIRKTLRKNLAYDGTLVKIEWKQVKKEKPKVFVICDVSGSVKTVSRFLLTFLYSLTEVLPRVRAFAFSNELGEVSDYFKQYPLEQAIEMSLDDFGKGSTDYGAAFRTFSQLCLGELDSKSTVIILGDSRNNFYDPGLSALKDISRHSRQVIWLNPESETRWGEGDAIMKLFTPHCTSVQVCNSLQDLERIVSGILRSHH